MPTVSSDIERLAMRLAELEATSLVAPADPTVANLKAELDTLAVQLRRAPADQTFENEPACGRVTAMVQALGRNPDDVSEQTFDTRETGKPSTTDAAPLGHLGIYELQTKLGEGGMGAVYKARHTKLDKIVAIKVLPAERMKDRGAVARFEREMRAVGKLEHPNIVRAMDAGEAGGMHYLVMEYVQGVDLSQLVKERGPLPIADACELIRQAAVGLDEAHDNQMVHRDIKPSNIMLCVVGKKKPPVVKILDMGLALLSEAHSADVQGLTTTGQMMGTLDYMAPEQGGDSKNVDIRADIYALGASLYKLLCGEAIYHGDKYQTPVQKMMALATHPAPPIQKRRKGISNELAAVLHRMLEKNPDKRFATPEQVAQALAPFCSGANLAALLNSAGFDIMPTKDASATQPSFSQPDSDTGVSIPSATPAKGGTGGSPTSAAAAKAKPPVAPVDKTNPALAKASAAKSSATPARVDKPPVPPIVPHIKVVAPSQKPLAKRGIRRQLPPWLPIAIGGGLLGLGGIALAAVVFFFQTPGGTLRVEINDPSIEVTVKGTDIVLKQADKEEITLTPGEHALVVKRGDFTFDTRNFELKKGETTTVKVELLPGKVQVALADGVILGEKAMGTQVATAEPRLPTPGTSGDPTSPSGVDLPAGKFALEFHDTDRASIAGVPYRDSLVQTVEAWIAIDNVTNTNRMDVINTPNGMLQVDGKKLAFYTFHSQAISEDVLHPTRRVHWAGVNDGKERRMYLNGKLISKTPDAGTVRHEGIGQRWPLFIGGDGGFHAIVDGVRVSTTARYDKEFTPPAEFAKDEATYALYLFNEGAGDTLHDASGNGFDLKITGAKWVRGSAASAPPTSSNPPAGKFALKFDRGNKAIAEKVPYLKSVPITVEAWATLEPCHDNPNAQSIVHTANGYLAVLFDGLTFYTYHGGPNVGGVIKPQQRVHIAGVNDGKMRRLYLNGKLIGKTDAPGGLNAEIAVQDNPLFPLTIGADKLEAVIDAVRVSKTARYDKEFTPPAELTKEDDTFALYLFNEGQGDVLHDSSGNGYDAKITGAKWVRGSGPTAAGIDGYALQFNVGAKSPDFHDVVVPTLKDEENLTMEFWMQRDASKILPNSLIMGFGMHQVQVMTNAPTQLAIAWNVAVPGDRVDPREAQEFFHVAAVRDATKKEVRLYVRGKLIGRHQYDAWDLGGHFEICSRTFQWKGEQDTTDYNFVGMIDETRISNITRYDADFTPQRRFEPDEHTQALYHFDEGQGDVLADSSGNNHHGKITGAKWVNGTAGDQSSTHARPALQVAGTKSYVELPLTLDDARQPLTVEAWLLHEDKDWRISLRAGEDTLQLIRDNKDQLSWMVVNADGKSSGVRGSLMVDKGEFTHLAATIDGEQLQLFVNGRPLDATPRTGKMPKVGNFPSYIGWAIPNPSGRADAAGTIAGVRISKAVRYRDAFTPASQLTTDADTLALYTCDEGQGDVLGDSSGNNHHGTIAGAKWVRGDEADSSRLPTRPVLQFAGVKSYAELPLKLPASKGRITVETWILNDDKELRIHLKADGDAVLLMRMDRKWHWLTLGANDQAQGIVAEVEQSLGAYSHVAAVSDAGSLKLFVDGKPVATKTQRRTMPNLSKLPSFIGYALPTDFGTHKPGGTISGVRISIAALYRDAFTPAQRLTVERNTVALYRCDEGSGEVLGDSSGHKLDGKIVGAKWVEVEVTPPSDALGFVPLFNGQDLTGWDAKRSASIDWTNESGTITGRNRSGSPNSAGVLQSQKDYRDFHFRCEVLAGSGAEPALLFRSGGRLVRGERHGYALTNPVPSSPTIAEGWGYGSLYADDFQVPPPQCRLAPATEKELGIKTGDWYRLEIIAQGEAIEIRVNDKETVRYTSSDPGLNRAGSLSLRCHAGTSVAFRNVEIKELAAP